MANTTIQIKSSGSAGVVPSGLANGELALNFADGKLYFKNSSSGTSYFSTTGGPAGPGGNNKEVQFNDAGTLTGNSSFTFDKANTTLTVGLPSSNANSIIQPSLIASGRFIKSPYQIAAPTSIVNKGSGILSDNGTISSQGIAPIGLAIDPTGKYVYVSNYSSANISQYSIDQTTGNLTSIGTITANTGPWKVQVDPTGRFVYAASSGQSVVSQYIINQSNGTLSYISSIGVGATICKGLAVDPTGRFLFAAGQNPESVVSAYNINQSNGYLSLIATSPTGSSSFDLAVDPTGRFM